MDIDIEAIGMVFEANQTISWWNSFRVGNLALNGKKNRNAETTVNKIV